MAAMHFPGQPHFAASPTSIPPSSAPPALPDRDVNETSIEDAYVAFILYCNPAVPPETDSAALRDAFRTPPKSGGKSFSTFTLFELIKQLETKELKTWAELALKLGVEPPDQEKGQSSQKIQQYAVRLKRWMHSMHIDAFFEYLIGRPSAYWTEIPSQHIPVSELERDGVAAEDDMALRALLPQIKPRRGRRKPEDDETRKSPSQRPSPQADEYGAAARPDIPEPWTAQPDGRPTVFVFPPVPDPSRLNPPGPSWGSSDIVQTPLTAYPIPQSAITPSTRNPFWADEPKSALTPSKPRSASRRHGAKVVSSAWRSGGIGAGGKARGRPPMNRGANSEGPFSAFPTSETPVFRFPSPTPEKNTAAPSSAAAPTSDAPRAKPANPLHAPPAAPVPAAPSAHPPGQQPPPPPPPPPASTYMSPVQDSAPPRPAKRSRLSLQVPERAGGEVRLATPPLPAQPAPPAPPTPPVLTVNGQAATEPPRESHAKGSGSGGGPGFSTISTQSSGTFVGASLPPGVAAVGERAAIALDPSDRTNMDEVEALFVSSLLRAEWYDAEQRRVPAGGVDEAWAIAQRVVENLLRAAPTKEAFLINLSALAGGKLLMPRDSLRVTRVEELPDRTRYACAWQLRFGDLVGNWAMEETVMHDRWKKKKDAMATGPQADGAGPDGRSGGGPEPDHWERKYKELAATLQKRDEEMARLKAMLIQAVRGGD